MDQMGIYSITLYLWTAWVTLFMYVDAGDNMTTFPRFLKYFLGKKLEIKGLHQSYNVLFFIILNIYTPQGDY